MTQGESCGLGSGRTRQVHSIHSLHAFVPVNANIPGLAADSHDIDAAVVIQVPSGQILDRHAPILDDVPSPLGPLAIQRLVQADATPLSGLVALVVAHADDERVAVA